MDLLSEVRDGWINLLPGVPEDEVEPPSQGVFSTLFSSAPAPVSMCTWMPAAGGRGTAGGRAAAGGRGTAGGQSVGILHPRGRYAVRQLGELGVAVPSSWRVSQDHARRGLIVHPAAGTAAAVVLDWMLRAGAALAVVPLTGSWQARVYLPRAASVAT